jgi:hypothetical protein
MHIVHCDAQYVAFHRFSFVCSSLASGAASHKALKGEHPILSFYYTFPYALFVVCLFNESALVMQYVLAAEKLGDNAM